MFERKLTHLLRCFKILPWWHFFQVFLPPAFFLFARNKAAKASELAAVDATQSSEVIFAMAGEMILLNAPLPDTFAFAGIFLVFAGLSLFIRFQEVAN